MGVRLPAEYQEVEYLESTGTQYIDTLVRANWSLGVDIVFALSRTDINSQLGAIVQNVNNSFTRHHLQSANAYNQTNKQFWYGYGLSGAPFILKSSLDLVQHHVTIKPYNNVFLWDGSPAAISSSEAFDTNLTYWLGARNASGLSITYFHGKLYSVKMWAMDDLIRDYIPCYRKADSKPGMYDLVTKQFFVNQGTGEFLVGPDVIDSISPWLVARRRMLMNLLTEVETMKLIKTVTLTESYESDSNGNAQNFRSMLFDEYKTEPNNLYVAVFSNNSASSYHADVMYISVYNGGYSNGAYYRNNYGNMQSAFTAQYSFHATIGTVIKVYAAR